MAGALAGAYLGEDGIPLRWREKVEGADELLILATRGVRIRRGPDPAEP